MATHPDPSASATMHGVDNASHCFVVPAYGESPYLEACLQSLRDQTTGTSIRIATSTPNSHIQSLADRYAIPVHVNSQRGGIASDWNFALEVATTPWVTLAHQDDVYLPGFSDRVSQAISRHADAVLLFSNYQEIEGHKVRPPTTLMRIKRVLVELGFVGGSRASTRFFKTNVLRFGCAIPCPAVTLKRSTDLRFRRDLKVDLDWAAWLELASKPGAFVFLREVLMQHRVHPESETSAAIDTGYRLAEDELLLNSLWPSAIARAILRSYRLAYRSNQVSSQT
jgi:glycosyltransferase involved in cell wall biosynthesis